MRSRAPSDVAIVGAGLCGLSLAVELARRGARVTVYERGEPGAGASWAGAGMLAPHSEFDPHDAGRAALGALCVASLDMYPDFARDLEAQTGVDIHLRTEGTLHVTSDPAALDAFATRAGDLRARGIDAQMMSRDEVLLREPALSGAVVGGLEIASEGQVDNRRMGRALEAAARSLGVRIESGCGEIALEADARRVRGVRSSAGYHAAEVVVNAAGRGADAVCGVPEEARVRIVPVKGQILALAIPAEFFHRVIWAPGVYLVPRRDGRLVIGATVERDADDSRVTALGVATLLAAALAAAPTLSDFALVETWAGVRPGTADGLPLIGPTVLDGYYVATGHYRNGILLAPITARVLSDVIEGRKPSVDLTPFAPGREDGARGSKREQIAG